MSHDLPVDKVDGCRLCDGSEGGVPGNENLITVTVGSITGTVKLCDYCHAWLMGLIDR